MSIQCLKSVSRSRAGAIRSHPEPSGAVRNLAGAVWSRAYLAGAVGEALLSQLRFYSFHN